MVGLYLLKVNQWGSVSNVPSKNSINFTTQFNRGIYKVLCIGKEGSNRDAIQVFTAYELLKYSFKVLSKRFDGDITNDFFDYVAIGF